VTSLFHTTSLLSRVALRLLLVVSLWEGPVVWGHSHTSVMSPSESLVAHIAAHHACESDATHLGWHWHFSIPEADGANPSPEKPTRRVAPSVLPAAESALVVTSLLANALAGHASPEALIDRDLLRSPSLFATGGTALPAPASRPELAARLRC